MSSGASCSGVPDSIGSVPSSPSATRSPSSRPISNASALDSATSRTTGGAWSPPPDAPDRFTMVARGTGTPRVTGQRPATSVVASLRPSWYSSDRYEKFGSAVAKRTLVTRSERSAIRAASDAGSCSASWSPRARTSLTPPSRPGDSLAASASTTLRCTDGAARAAYRTASSLARLNSRGAAANRKLVAAITRNRSVIIRSSARSRRRSSPAAHSERTLSPRPCAGRCPRPAVAGRCRWQPPPRPAPGRWRRRAAGCGPRAAGR